jgi:LysM repeat protein
MPMRRGLLLTVSVAVNLVFAAMLIYIAKNPSHAIVTPALADASGGTNAHPKPQYVVRKQFFNWDQVESPDYPVYIARLREIGCPEETIHDIVIADVNKLFAAKRLNEVPTADQEWWRSTADTNLTAAAAAKSAQLDQERRALLTTLLGANWEAGVSAHTTLSLTGPILGDLSPETKQAVRDAVAKSQERTRAYLADLAASGKSPDPAAMARLESQMRADLSKILSGAQLEEFLLRYSATADNLRKQLHGYDVTPDEFRAIFRLQDPIVQQLALGSGPNDSAAEQAAQTKQLQDAIKDVLGPDRWQTFQLSQDPAYQDALAVGSQYDAPPDVVQALYRLNLAGKQMRDQINNDPNLTPDQKADELNALAAQEQADGDQLLGVTPPEQPAAPAPPPPPMQIHNFSPGETLDQIAARYGVTAADIINANPTINLNVIASGTPIRVPVKQ